MPAEPQTWDVIVIGAGPAGSIAARELARRGAAVLLVDKAEFPRPKVCGCCLNLQALATLADVGLGELVDRHGAVPLIDLKLAAAGSHAIISLPGKTLSRGVFDSALVDAAVEAGARFQPQTQARVSPGIGPTRSVALRCKGQETIACARVIVGAEGLGGRLLTGDTGPAIVAEGSRLGAGVIATEASTFYQPGTVYMACGTGGYVGLVRIEDGRLNLAAALDASLVKQARGLGNAAAMVLDEAGFPPIVGLASLPWHGTPLLTRRAPSVAGERMFLIGDAASYVEPFSGEGMAWALASGVAVVPFALRACHAWEPALARRWSAHYRRAILKRQWVCRAAASVLRHPRLMRWTVAALTYAPGLAAPVIRYINHARAR